MTQAQNRFSGAELSRTGWTSSDDDDDDDDVVAVAIVVVDA